MSLYNVMVKTWDRVWNEVDVSGVQFLEFLEDFWRSVSFD